MYMTHVHTRQIRHALGVYKHINITYTVSYHNKQLVPAGPMELINVQHVSITNTLFSVYTVYGIYRKLLCVSNSHAK